MAHSGLYRPHLPATPSQWKLNFQSPAFSGASIDTRGSKTSLPYCNVCPTLIGASPAPREGPSSQAGVLIHFQAQPSSFVFRRGVSCKSTWLMVTP